MLDLFSGIGGFSLAASWVWPDLEIVSFVEIDKYCQKVLIKNFPGVPIHPDIKEFKADGFGTIDLVCGGFPCQPFSTAGKRKGKEDDRDLWPEMFRVIQEARPAWVIGENVAGFINMDLDRSISDLESAGYEVEPISVSACGLQAWQRRERIWILATNIRGNSDNFKPAIYKNEYHLAKIAGTQQSLECKHNGIYKPCAWDNPWNETNTPILCGRDDGIPNRVDRIKGLGNAIVPQVAAMIMQGIKEVEHAS
jgi:DNA (cytosine-5)-methyltransferase 1